MWRNNSSIKMHLQPNLIIQFKQKLPRYDFFPQILIKTTKTVALGNLGPF